MIFADLVNLKYQKKENCNNKNKKKRKNIKPNAVSNEKNLKLVVVILTILLNNCLVIFVVWF